MQELRQRVGHRLRALRQDRRLTQEELAELAEIHPTFLAKIEAGQRLPSLVVIKRLANALGVPTASIVSTVDECEWASPEDRVVDELVAHLKSCTIEELEFVKDFIMMLKRHARRS